MVYIVPFDFCNIASVCRYFESRSIDYQFLSKENSPMVKVDWILIPGVGTFQEGMYSLQDQGLINIISNFVSHGGSVVGICLGMQLMFEISEESPGIKGLGLIKGVVKRLSSCQAKIPRVGWDAVYVKEIKQTYSLFTPISENIDLHPIGPDFFYVHSFYCNPNYDKDISGWLKHGDSFYCASIESDNLYGMQFHPEKSGGTGYKALDAIFLAE